MGFQRAFWKGRVQVHCPHHLKPEQVSRKRGSPRKLLVIKGSKAKRVSQQLAQARSHQEPLKSQKGKA